MNRIDRDSPFWIVERFTRSSQPSGCARHRPAPLPSYRSSASVRPLRRLCFRRRDRYDDPDLGTDMPPMCSADGIIWRFASARAGDEAELQGELSACNRVAKDHLLAKTKTVRLGASRTRHGFALRYLFDPPAGARGLPLPSAPLQRPLLARNLSRPLCCASSALLRRAASSSLAFSLRRSLLFSRARRPPAG